MPVEKKKLITKKEVAQFLCYLKEIITPFQTAVELKGEVSFNTKDLLIVLETARQIILQLNRSRRDYS